MSGDVQPVMLNPIIPHGTRLAQGIRPCLGGDPSLTRARGCSIIGSNNHIGKPGIRGRRRPGEKGSRWNSSTTAITVFCVCAGAYAIGSRPEKARRQGAFPRNQSGDLPGLRVKHCSRARGKNDRHPVRRRKGSSAVPAPFFPGGRRLCLGKGWRQGQWRTAGMAAMYGTAAGRSSGWTFPRICGRRGRRSGSCRP